MKLPGAYTCIVPLLSLLLLAAPALCQGPAAEHKPTGEAEAKQGDANEKARKEPARDWSNVMTFSLVTAMGNSSAGTWGLSNDYTKKWDMNALVLKCGAIRSESTKSTYTAVGGSLDDAVVRRNKYSYVTAENIFADTRFDYRLKEKHRWYWYCGARWERNRPVGLDTRTAVTVGAGRIFVDTVATKFRLDIGTGLTREDPVVRPDSYRRDFGTLNFTSEIKQRVSPSVGYTADVSSAYDIKHSGGWLIVLKQGVTVAARKSTVLKVGCDMTYRDIPPLILVPAYTDGDPPTHLGVIRVKAKKLDLVTTTSLVVPF